MKLITESKHFKEVIKQYDIYENTAFFTRSQIPEGCFLSVEQYNEHILACVYRLHPFNAQVTTARHEQIAYSNLRGDSAPTVRFAIDGWTPEKLAEMQVKTAERAAKYAELTRKYQDAAKAYNAALEAQRREITGET